MSGFLNLTKKQQLFILINSILCVFICICSFAMCFFFTQIEKKNVPGKELLISLCCLIGWCVLIYFSFIFISKVLENRFFEENKSITYADATLQLKNLNVGFFE